MLVVGATLVCAPSLARAFDVAAQFFDNKALAHAATFGASGEGIYFTGAPRFASLNCSDCHAGGPQVVGLRFNADDESLFAAGYQPGKTYQLEVELTNETEGISYSTPTCTDPPLPGDTSGYVQCNNNGFALEIDAAGVPLAGAGVYCANPPMAGICPMPDVRSDESVVAPDGDAVFANRMYSADPDRPKVERNGATSWRFFWTAPRAGTGPLTVYVAAVDGNGGAGNAANDQDPYNDDTVAANFFLQEADAPVPRAAAAGCSVAGSSAPPPLPALLVSLLVLLLGVALRRSVRVAAAGAAVRFGHESQAGVRDR